MPNYSIAFAPHDLGDSLTASPTAAVVPIITDAPLLPEGSLLSAIGADVICGAVDGGAVDLRSPTADISDLLLAIARQVGTGIAFAA